MNSNRWMLYVFLLLFGLSATGSLAQDRLKTMPGYSHYQKMSAAMTNAVKLGSLSVTWKDGGKALEYDKDGKRFRYDIASKSLTEIPKPKSTATNAPPRPSGEGRREGRRPASPARGRQFTSATSPDGKFKAVYR